MIDELPGLVGVGFHQRANLRDGGPHVAVVGAQVIRVGLEIRRFFFVVRLFVGGERRGQANGTNGGDEDQGFYDISFVLV